MMQQPYTWSGPNPISTPPDFSSLTQRLNQSEQQLKQMTEQLTQLQKQIEEIKNKPPLHIEYHFDQLKVNHLEGTLNVGLTPQGVQGIESFEAPDPASMQVAPTEPEEEAPPIRSLQTEVESYMKDKSADLLISLERQYAVSLEEEHRSRVIDDVRKQLDERVHYYARTSSYPSKGTEEDVQKWKDSIKDKAYRDIQGAFSAYLSKLQQQASQRRNNP